MPTAEITVEFCNPRKEGKKNASIKTKEGDFYIVPPEMYPSFAQGGKYEVEYSTFKSNTGDVLRTVKGVKELAGALASAPATAAKRGGYAYQDDPIVAERIYVCGMLNAIHQNQNSDPRGFTVEDIVNMTNVRREAWRKTFGNPQKSADLDDEIPF